jgi:hypothetical protein
MALLLPETGPAGFVDQLFGGGALFFSLLLCVLVGATFGAIGWILPCGNNAFCSVLLRMAALG